MGTPTPTPPTASPFLDVAKFVDMIKPDLVSQVGDSVLAQVTGTLTSTATDVAGRLHQESLAGIADLGARLTTIENDLLPKVDAAAGHILLNVEEDPTTQRILICSVVGALLLAGLIVLVAALFGNATANRWIAAAPIAIGAAVLWVSRAGVPLPKQG